MRLQGRHARSQAWNACVNAGDVQRARWLLDHGLKPHPEQDGYFLEQSLFTALNGPVAMIGLLVEAGADPNRQDAGQYRDYPLLRALRYNRFDHARALLAHGANPDARDFSRFTSSMIALDTSDFYFPSVAVARAHKARAWAMVRDLVKAGANPDKSRKGQIYLFGYADHPARLRWMGNRLNILMAPDFMLGNVLCHGLHESSDPQAMTRMMDHHLSSGADFNHVLGLQSEGGLTVFQLFLKDIIGNTGRLEKGSRLAELLGYCLNHGADPTARNASGSHAFDLVLDMAEHYMEAGRAGEVRLCNDVCELMMDHTTWAHLSLAFDDGKTVFDRLSDLAPSDRLQALLDRKYLEKRLPTEEIPPGSQANTAEAGHPLPGTRARRL
jgi:hypothetical protein